MAQQKKAAEANARLPATPKKGGQKKGGMSTPLRSVDAGQLDLAGLNLDTPEPPIDEPPPKITVSREKVLEEARKALQGKDDRKGVSLVVIGETRSFVKLLDNCLVDLRKAMSMPESRH